MTDRKRKNMIIGAGVMAVVLLIIIVVLISMFAPSHKIMKLTKYFDAKKGEVVLILQDAVSEEKGIYEGGQVYVGLDLVQEYFNHRFYWDGVENILIYTTPSRVMKAQVGKKEYSENKSANELDYQPVKFIDDKVYVALDYVKKFSDIQYEMFKDPLRAVITYRWGENATYAKVKNETELRIEADVKSDVLAKLPKEEKLLLLDSSDEVGKGFVKAMTQSGVIGYVKKNNMAEGKEETAVCESKAEKYSHIKMKGKVNLVWHQVTNTQANDSLLNLLDATKGVNVIAPTWFAVEDNKGGISSLASDTYVDRAHNAGVQVWALCNDFGEKVNMLKLLSKTSSREKLEKELIAAAIKYNIDGINIDFENITSEAGPHFVQFVRELSIKCRNNELVLSIDNYPPTAYTAYYDRKEQGEVADYVITMAYDEHYAASEESGSVASIGFVEDAVKNTLEEVNPSQAIIALPFYTRLWKETKKDGKTELEPPQSYSMTSAANLLTDYNVKAKWDKETMQYYGEWKEGKTTCRIWLEEEKSIEAKLKAAKEGKVAGYAFWKLGLEKAIVWDTIAKYTN